MAVNRRLSLRWFEPKTCHQVNQQLRDATASLLRAWGRQPDVTGGACASLVVGYAWDGGRLVWAVSGLIEDWFRSSGETLWDASGVAQGGVYLGVGDRLVVAQALGVEAEQDLDAVPGPLGDPWCGYPGASQRETPACRRS